MSLEAGTHLGPYQILASSHSEPALGRALKARRIETLENKLGETNAALVRLKQSRRYNSLGD